jgi:hypothetical protein
VSDQKSWKIPVTPAQRWVLFNMSHADGEKVQGQAGRVLRRFMRAFGIVAISETAQQHNGVVATMVRDTKPRLHTVTIENVESAVKLQDIAHTPAQEMVVGELLDLLEDLKRTKEYTPPEGIPDYDPAAEDWTPVKTDPIEAAAEKIAGFVRAKGANGLADAILRGEWDTTEEPQPAADA